MKEVHFREVKWWAKVLLAVCLGLSVIVLVPATIEWKWHTFASSTAISVALSLAMWLFSRAVVSELESTRNGWARVSDQVKALTDQIHTFLGSFQTGLTSQSGSRAASGNMPTTPAQQVVDPLVRRELNLVVNEAFFGIRSMISELRTEMGTRFAEMADGIEEVENRLTLMIRASTASQAADQVALLDELGKVREQILEEADLLLSAIGLKMIDTVGQPPQNRPHTPYRWLAAGAGPFGDSLANLIGAAGSAVPGSSSAAPMQGPGASPEGDHEFQFSFQRGATHEGLSSASLSKPLRAMASGGSDQQ